MSKPKNVTYGILTWGPCVMHLKISEEFQKKLLEEGEASRKLKLDYRSRLAGILKEEYAYDKSSATNVLNNIELTRISDITLSTKMYYDDSDSHYGTNVEGDESFIKLAGASLSFTDNPKWHHLM